MCAAQLRGSKHNTHTARTHRAQFTGRAALARRLRAGINTTGHARGTHYPTFHFKNTQVMEATLKKQRHQGALVITGPLVSPALTYLSALSGCRVTRTKDAKFAPQRTIQEKNAFIKEKLGPGPYHHTVEILIWNFEIYSRRLEGWRRGDCARRGKKEPCSAATLLHR